MRKSSSVSKEVKPLLVYENSPMEKDLGILMGENWT